METIDRYFPESPGSFFLFGPRGTGKTTLLKRRFSGALWIDLLSPAEFRSYSARPERLRELVGAHPGASSVVIDEVQRVPELLSVVHGLIEEKKERQFILTGSSARKLKRKGVDMLAGRAVLRTLHPFMASELGDSFVFARALDLGLVPLVVDAANCVEVRNSYASLYLREEVQEEGLVRNIGGFARFMEAVSFSHGAVLNVSNVARECQIERKVVEGYIGILEDLLLGYRLPVFSRRAKRAVAAHPKFYLFDSGVFRSLRPTGPLDRPAEIDGPALEGLVGQHLRAWIGYTREQHHMSYWRTRAGVEVDFVLYGETGFWAFEVKNGARVDTRDLRGLRALREDYPECKAYMLYRGKEVLLRDDVLCVPCELFLRQLRPGQAPDAGLC